MVFGFGLVGLLPVMGLLPAARAQSSRAAYEITFSPLARTGSMGFLAQDLAEARNDPADPGSDLPKYVSRALQAFAQSRGRAPEQELDRIVAVVDWVAATLRHPAFYPEDPGLPRSYPLAPSTRYDTLSYEPVRIINYTLQFDPARPESWPSPQCTQQNLAAAGMLNVLGLHARLVDVEGHTGLEVYSFVHYKWIWVDATFNEHYVDADGMPLGVMELNRLTLEGGIEGVRAVKHGYPTAQFAANTYLRLYPHGFRQYAVTRNMRIFGGKGLQISKFDTVVFSPMAPASYRPLPGEVPNYESDPSSGGWYFWPKTDNPESLDFPLGRLAVFDGVVPTEDGLSLRLRSFLPYTTRFQIRFGDQPDHWTTVAEVASPSAEPALSEPIVVPWGAGAVSIRAVDNVRNVSLPLVLQLSP
jgi:hypothetical protein